MVVCIYEEIGVSVNAVSRSVNVTKGDDQRVEVLFCCAINDSTGLFRAQ